MEPIPPGPAPDSTSRSRTGRTGKDWPAATGPLPHYRDQNPG